MTYANKLRYAGSKPFEPEYGRYEDGELTYHEYEALTQDDTYQRLAEVRWLADELEGEITHDDSVPNGAGAALFDAVDGSDAPLREAVEIYVEAWLAEYRGAKETDGGAE